MPKVSSKAVGVAILEALGLETAGVQEFTIRIAVREPVTIEVLTKGIELPNGADGLLNAAKILTKYHLVEAEEEDDHET